MHSPSSLDVPANVDCSAGRAPSTDNSITCRAPDFAPGSRAFALRNFHQDGFAVSARISGNGSKIGSVANQMARKKAPELNLSNSTSRTILVREHKYGVLEQSDITDTEHFIAEDQLWAFLKATQADTLKKLEDDYGTDARDEVFKALRKELEHTPLWMLLRHGLKVRGLEFRLFYPKPRSAESAAAEKYAAEPHHLPPAFLFRRDESGD